MSEAQLIEVHPVEASRSGKNAYYHFCDIRGAKQNYSVCLHILKARDEDRIHRDDFVDCQRACLRGECEALKMRAQEKAAGRALFYTPRVERNPANTRTSEEAQRDAMKVRTHSFDMSNAGYARGWAMAGGEKPVTAGEQGARPAPKKSKPAKPKTGYTEANYADLVNAIASESASKATPAPAPQSQPMKPLPGETPLQFAKRRAQAKQGA